MLTSISERFEAADVTGIHSANVFDAVLANVQPALLSQSIQSGPTPACSFVPENSSHVLQRQSSPIVGTTFQVLHPNRASGDAADGVVKNGAEASSDRQAAAAAPTQSGISLPSQQATQSCDCFQDRLRCWALLVLLGQQG